MGSALLVMDMQNGIVERIADKSTLLIGAIYSAQCVSRNHHERLNPPCIPDLTKAVARSYVEAAAMAM